MAGKSLKSSCHANRSCDRKSAATQRGPSRLVHLSGSNDEGRRLRLSNFFGGSLCWRIAPEDWRSPERFAASMLQMERPPLPARNSPATANKGEPLPTIATPIRAIASRQLVISPVILTAEIGKPQRRCLHCHTPPGSRSSPSQLVTRLTWRNHMYSGKRNRIVTALNRSLRGIGGFSGST